MLFLDDDTIRQWHNLFVEDGLEGLTRFEAGGSASFLNAAQEDAVKAFVAARLPRSIRRIGAFIGSEFGVVYESRSGLIAWARIAWGLSIASRKSLAAISTKPGSARSSSFTTSC